MGYQYLVNCVGSSEDENRFGSYNANSMYSAPGIGLS